jgi:membrane protease YdiL (CAAX protease family)
MTTRAAGPSFWTVVFLLLRAARQRTAGRIRRHIKLRQRRGGIAAALGPALGFVFVCLLAVALHAGAASDMLIAVSSAQRVQAEANGKVVVDEWFAGRIENYEADAAKNPAKRQQINNAENHDIAVEALRLANQRHVDSHALATQLWMTIHNNPKALLSAKSLWWQPGRLPDIIALIILLWWSMMLVCQGEGPELDTQRPRNPMWEWLFSHPASPGAIFLAEMLTPIAANPIYLTAPIFPGVLFGWTYGWLAGIAAAFLIGLPAMIALACVGKALEIRTLLRLPPRARGAVLGLMGWFGFASMLLFLFISSSIETITINLAHWLAPFTWLPWPPARMLLGRTEGGNYVFWLGLVLCWLVAAILIAGAVAFAAATTRRGLAYQPAPGARPARIAGIVRFGRDPLHRKELLWFRRDGSALVQAVLVPLSLAALQAFNLRGMLSNATIAWNTISGTAILFGTYFLLILGPKSLSSEGQALWIAQTWPRGLESLLQAKARLWAEIATAIVVVVLLYAAFRFPSDIGAIVAVGIAWWVFARSLAEKTVTLATVTSSSGEVERPPVGMRWAATLGTLTFAIGVLTQQWSLAVAGVVYSMLTAAAMWQNFRYRLPFLSDPWSETAPPPPTLLHAMVAISAMLEGISLLSALALWLLGRDNIAAANAALYGLCAIIAAAGVSYFLAGRGVTQRDIWLWRNGIDGPLPFLGLDAQGRLRVILLIAGGAALGAALGLAAHGYLAGLRLWPDLAQMLDQARSRMDAIPNARTAYFVMAVVFAPFAEEFLFRGLLYRALDSEWPGWRAVVGAGVFFAAYHPYLSWGPVAALGMINALLFKRTGRLAPAIAAHMAYNAVVLAF